ncbi:MAG: glutathione S-transferase family protein [Pseudomonadota bacterium]
MLQVYAIPVSLYCAKLRILLRHKGLEWEEIPPPGGYGSDEYKTHVPSGNLPALRDGGLLIADSEAIAEYLEEKFPEPPMLPSDPAARAKVRELSRFHDTRLEPALRALFPYLPGRATAPDGFLADQSGQISVRLSQLGRMMGEGAGQTLCLADCGYPISFVWLEALAPRMGFALEWPDTVRAYRERLAQNAAVADELSEYTPKLTAFLDG